MTETKTEQRHVAVPGELLLSPVVVLSVAALLLNDHYLKARFHNALTGKLSDFAGLIVFPCVLVALVEWARFARIFASIRGSDLAQQLHSPLTEHASFGASKLEIILACGVTALAFTAIKVSVVASDIYCSGVTSVSSWLNVPWFTFTKNITDASDLVALPALFVPLWLALYRRRPASRGSLSNLRHA